jgi:type I restriction enzyme S subunit
MNPETFFDNFGLLADTPNGVQKLRKLILQLAVQGKLVPQDLNDESAAVLLEKIRAEKERLIKEKKLKKTKENGEILKDEYIAHIPKNWILSKIVDLGFVTKLAGFEYTKYIKLEDCGEVPVIRAQNVRMNYIDECKLKFIDMDASNLLDRCALTKKAILITFIGAGIGDVAIFDKNERWHLAPNVAKIEPFNNYEEKIDIKYLLYYLMSNTGRHEIFKFRKATAQPSLSMGTIRQAIVALPPLEEQRRIATKVDQLMALCGEPTTGSASAITLTCSMVLPKPWASFARLYCNWRCRGSLCRRIRMMSWQRCCWRE